MIELIVYPKPTEPRLINVSPFCAKAEVFLKMSKVDFKLKEFKGNPSKFPNKKLPVICHNSKIIPDSSFIQKYIEKEFSINLNKYLSNQEIAQGFAFSKMLEEYFYWSLLHERWLIDRNFQKLKSIYFGNIPLIIRNIIASIVRKNTKKSAIGHGMSRHSNDGVLKLGQETLIHLSNFLAERKFLLGDKISSFDSTTYAFVSNILHSPVGPFLKEEGLKYKNLVEYDKRMFELVYT